MLMNAELQRKAQRRADRIASFRAELAELEQEQALVLNPEQRARLDAHYDQLLAGLARQFGIDTSDSAKRVSWAMRIGTFLSAVALFAALVLFCYRIWGLVPSFAQTALAVLIPLALLAATEIACRRQIASYYTALLALASGAGFILGLNAVGSTWNLEPSPHALLAWGLFALLLAYACDLRLLLAAGLLLLCAYSSALSIAVTGGFWVNFMERPGPMVAAAAIMYALPWVAPHRKLFDFDFVYRVCGAGAGLLALLILSESHDLSCSTPSTHTLSTLYQVIGLLLSAAVVSHGLRLGRGGLVNLGAAGFVVFLYIRLQAWFWDWLPKYLFFLLVALTALALVLVFRRLRLHLAEREPP